MAKTNSGARKEHSAIYAPVMLIIVCASLIFAMSVFFRVSEIEVIGEGIYTEEEIIAAASIVEGDNLFFTNRLTAISNIYARLSYVELASVERQLPNKIVIEVSETTALAYIPVDMEVVETTTDEETGVEVTTTSYVTEYWVIDRNGKYLENANSGEVEGLIEIRGIDISVMDIGDNISEDDVSASMISYIKIILDQVQERGLVSYVKYLDFSSGETVVFSYDSRYTVTMSLYDNMEYSFGLLVSAVSKLANGDRGTIEIGENDSVKVNLE